MQTIMAQGIAKSELEFNRLESRSRTPIILLAIICDVCTHHSMPVAEGKEFRCQALVRPCCKLVPLGQVESVLKFKDLSTNSVGDCPG